MNIYKRHRFPPEIIQYAVWLYFRFNLSHRDIEERGMTAGVNYPFNFLLGRDSSLAEKRECMERFAEQYIVKLA